MVAEMVKKDTVSKKEAPKKDVVKKVAQPKVELQAGVSQDDAQENTVQDGQVQNERHPGPWVKLSKEMVLRHSMAGNLIGHDHKTNEVILVDPDLEPPVLDENPVLGATLQK